MRSWWTRVLAAVIILGVIAAGYAMWERHRVEQDNRGLETAVVYREAVELTAFEDDFDADDLLEDLKDRGVTTVLFKEDTPGILEDRGDFNIGTGSEINELYGIKDSLPEEEYSAGDTYLITEDKDAWQRVRENMEAKGIPFQAHELSRQDKYLLSTALKTGELTEQGLGFPREIIEQVSAKGFNIMVQPRTWYGVEQKEIEKVFGAFSEISNLSGVLFNDDKLPGYVKNNEERKVLLRALAEDIKELGVPLVQIEFEDQKGFENVARAMDKQVVRLHTIPNDEMKQYTPGGALDRYELAVTERNIRVLLVRFFSGEEYPVVTGEDSANYRLLEKLEKVLTEQHDFKAEKASVFSSPGGSNIAFPFIAFGVAAGGIMLSYRLFPRRAAQVISILGVLGILVILGAAFIKPSSLLIQAKQVTALAAAVIFPALAVVTGVPRHGLRPGKALLRFLQVSLITLVGGVFTAGLLSDTGFMLKLDQFLGVKAALGAPLLIIALYFFFATADGVNWLDKIFRVWKKPVTVGLAVIALLLLGLLGFYMLRSGNMGVTLPFETAFRNMLEELLGVRPRTKEFLLGHPLFILLIYTGCRDLRYLPLLLLGAVGQVSMVNTFAHIHTPLVISVIRTVNGIWPGIIGGLVLIGVWYVLDKSWKRYAVPGEKQKE